MPFIDTLPIDAIDDTVRRMYARQQAFYGYVPSYAKVFCHRPEIMELWAALIRGIKRNLDKRRYELVTFVAANALKNSLCSLAHGGVLSEFFSADEVKQLARHELPASLSAADVCVIAFARKVATDAAQITRADVDALKEHGLSDAEIFDISATAAARAFWTKVIDSLGSDGDELARPRDASFTEALAVGRPIHFAAPEYVDTGTGSDPRGTS